MDSLLNLTAVKGGESDQLKRYGVQVFNYFPCVLVTCAGKLVIGNVCLLECIRVCC